MAMDFFDSTLVNFSGGGRVLLVGVLNIVSEDELF